MEHFRGDLNFTAAGLCHKRDTPAVRNAPKTDGARHGRLIEAEGSGELRCSPEAIDYGFHCGEHESDYMFKLNTRQECSSRTLQNILPVRRKRMSYPYEAVGRRLVMLRQAVGVKPADLCRQTGINPSLWSQFEKGKRRIPLDDAIILRERYGATLDWLYVGDGSGLTVQMHSKIAALSSGAAVPGMKSPH